MKNRKVGTWLLSGLMLFGLALPVQAETFYGDSNWNVTFNANNEMVSSFSTANINDVVSGMQPGDNVIITLKLKSENASATDWYMQNEVLYSLEDRSANKQTGGGAYTYRLVYTDKSGTRNVLFDSDTVGGESGGTVDDMLADMGEGLRGATNALKDYFYLDTLYNGQGGTITLEVALDGETQGNDYQNTLADLQMNFAVEMNPDAVREREETSGRTEEERIRDRASARGTSVVRTGDESNLTPFVIASSVSGVLLLLLSMYGVVGKKEEKKEGQ